MARSTLELLLDSIKDRDEEPPDHLPALPQRPTSKARLPSRKRTSALLLADPSSEQQYGHIQDQAHHSSDASRHHSNGHRHPEAHIAHTHVEVFSPAYQNGHHKETQNADQPTQNSMPAKGVVAEILTQETLLTENRFSGNGDFAEPALRSDKQVPPARAYSNLRKRRRVHHLNDLQKDSRVWLYYKDNKWVLGSIQSASDLESVICMADEQLLEMPSERLLPANPEFLDEVDDVVQLSYIHEPAVFHVLQRRYERGMHCTKAGSSLIVITPPKENPLQSCSQSFKKSSLEALNSMATGFKQPHVYTIVDNAHDSMTTDWKDQSIIIGGECFAGKTESAKAVLKHLVSLGNNDELGNTLLKSNMVLEAFGSANIASSVSASRCGKVVDANFDKEGNLCSARVQIVFLEKSRVVCRAEAEHSFHIFYQLCEGADTSLREKLNLREAIYYNYLKNSTCENGVHPCSDFLSLLNALHILGFSEKIQQHIFSLLGAILWLGNITSVGADNNEAVDNAANLLNCSKKDLVETLSYAGRNPENVSAVRDALACAIYERLFYWLVAQINKAMKSKTAPDSKSITIVDMPGFGFSKSDGLEGLLVNYAQEHLQCFTRWHLLQLGEEVATCGGSISYTTNSSSKEESINFLEYELLPLIVNHEGGASLEQSESGFLRCLNRLLAGSSCCKQPHSETLIMAHAFGEATYNVGSFLKELKILSNPHTRQLLHSCMTNLLAISSTNDNGDSWKSSSQAFSSHGPFSTSQERVLQMMQQLEDTEPHFIFCMAPSESQLARTLEQGYVIRQLHINKITEAARLHRSGDLISIPHRLFASRFGPLLGPDIKKVYGPLGTSVAVLQRLQVPSHMYQMEWTRIFFCSEQVDRLEHARKQFLSKIVEIQKTFRGYRVRKQLERQRVAVTHLQSSVRSWLVRRGLLHQREGKTQMKDRAHEYKVGTELDSELAKKVLGPCQDSVEIGDPFVQKDAVTSILAGRSADLQEYLPKKRGNIMEAKSFHGYGEQKEQVKTSSNKSRAQPTEAELALNKKEEEIFILQQSVKEYERKWIAYEAKMKSMEETWQKQVSLLEQRLSVATKGSNTEESAYKTGDSDKGVVISTPPHCASTRDTPDTTIGDPDVTVSKNELDPSRSAIDHLSKELEHRTQVFNDDARFLVEVKSGQIEANFKPDEELQKLRQRFEVWKKDYKGRLKETKVILKKLGKSDATEKNKRRWWSKR